MAAAVLTADLHRSDHKIELLLALPLDTQLELDPAVPSFDQRLREEYVQTAWQCAITQWNLARRYVRIRGCYAAARSAASHDSRMSPSRKKVKKGEPSPCVIRMESPR